MPYTDLERETKFEGENYKTANNIYHAQYPIYARWDPYKKTVVYNEDGRITKAFSITYGTGQRLIENMSKKSGYKFIGWVSDTGKVYTDRQDVDSVLVGEKDNTTGTIRLTAKWETDDNAVQITYKGNGGRINGAISYSIWVNKGEGIRKIETKKGNDTTTRYIDKDGNVVDYNRAVDKSMIVYADFGSGITPVEVNLSNVNSVIIPNIKPVAVAVPNDAIMVRDIGLFYNTDEYKLIDISNDIAEAHNNEDAKEVTTEKANTESSTKSSDDAKELNKPKASQIKSYAYYTTRSGGSSISKDAITPRSEKTINAPDKDIEVSNGNFIYNPLDNTWSYRLSGSNEDAKDGWYLINNGTTNSWYRFDVDGHMQVGFYDDGRSIYYLEPNTTSKNYGSVVKGIVDVLGSMYYFDDTGRYDPVKSKELNKTN